jgi:DHA2 family lincomycin resistance protein-like MFS transporter
MAKQAKRKLPAHAARILYILLAANFVVALNETVLGVALPSVMKDLHISASIGQWLTAAFLLTVAVVIPVTGFLQAKYSTRVLFFAAMGIFTLGTLLGALSVSFDMLLAGRVLQAAGTALLMPMFMTTMMKVVPEDMRGQVMGQISLVFSVAPALGPAASGLIVQFWGWKGLFWVVLPISVLAFLIGGKWLHLEHEAGPVRLDFLSLVLSGVGFSALIYGLSEVGPAVRGDAPVNPAFVIVPGALIVAWFAFRQLKLAPKNAALLDLGTFKSKVFSNAILLMVALMAGLFGTIIIVPIYMQNVLHQTALVTGLVMMPGGLLQGLLGSTAGKFFDRYGARTILVPALSGVAVSVGIMATFGVATPLWLIFVAYTLLSVALGFCFPALFGTAMSSLTPELYSHGSATVGVVQQVAGAAGTAGFVAVLTMLAGGNTQTASIAAMATGTHGAFLMGFVVSLISIGLAFGFKAKKNQSQDGLAQQA